jgi:hypothetical protein
MIQKEKRTLKLPIIKVIQMISTLEPTETERIISEYHGQFYAHKLNNLNEMNQFFESHKLSKLTEDKIDNLNTPVCTKEIKFKTFLKRNVQVQMVLLVNYNKHLKKH